MDLDKPNKVLGELLRRLAFYHGISIIHFEEGHLNLEREGEYYISLYWRGEEIDLIRRGKTAAYGYDPAIRLWELIPLVEENLGDIEDRIEEWLGTHG